MSRYLALVESTVGETVEKPGALARVAPDGSDVELLVGPDTWVSEPGLIRYVLNGEPGAELIDEAAALDLVERFPWPGMRAAIAQAARAAGMFDPRLAAEFDESEWEREGGRFHAFIGEKEERAAGEDRRDENGVPLDERGDVDVDRYVSENPRRKGEDVFVWQGRIVEGLDRETQSEVLYETRERYDRVEELWEGAQRWNEENGLGPIPANVADLRADLDEADAVARFMENAKDESQSPLVHVAYDDFKRQNAEMYDYMTRPRAEGGLGVRVEYTTERDPYPSAEAQAADLRDNGRIIIESGLGGDHSALSVEEYDQFRAVHDVFGHAAIGGGFDRHGEYQAWVTHAAMYTGPGRQAMSTEYHGVNSAMWAGEPGTPGTGMSVLLPDGFADPPWMRQQAIVGAASTRSQKRVARALVAKLRLDPDFAREFSHVAWHTRGGPTPEAFLAAEREYVRDELGRFGETGDGAAGGESGAASGSVIDRVRSQGGITVEPLTGREPADGYVVAKSLEATRILPEREFFEDRAQGVAQIASYLRDNAADFDDDGAMLGIWHDVDNAEVVFDVVENVADRDTALQRGRDRDQQAVWDVAGGVEIATGGTGGRQGAAADQGGEAAEADRADDRRGTGSVRGRGVRPRNVELRAVERLTRLRGQLGTKLLALARHAYEGALATAGARVNGRARSRASKGRQAQVAAAVENHEPLSAWLGAVGITELELLRGSFDTFAKLARDEIDRYHERAVTAIERAGFDPADYLDPAAADDAVEYLVVGLNAMARRRLLLGDEALLAAISPRLIPLARRRALSRAARQELLETVADRAAARVERRRSSGGGFDLPGLPDPDELAAAAARLVRNALDINDAVAVMRLATTPDELPEVVATARPTVAEQLALDIEIEPVWEWRHGFYGEPITPFDRHADLDGLRTSTRVRDERLANPEPWPPSDHFYPGDHDGCTCEWVIEARPGGRLAR